MKHLTFPIINNSNKEINLYLELMPEHYKIQSGQKIVVHALVKESCSQVEFILEIDSENYIVYTPGGFVDYIDSYVTYNELRLKPLPD
jgi:hypothetical protein